MSLIGFTQVVQRWQLKLINDFQPVVLSTLEVIARARWAHCAGNCSMLQSLWQRISRTSPDHITMTKHTLSISHCFVHSDC
jgi:hypothetical protein